MSAARQCDGCFRFGETLEPGWVRASVARLAIYGRDGFEDLDFCSQQCLVDRFKEGMDRMGIAELPPTLQPQDAEEERPEAYELQAHRADGKWRRLFRGAR